jgi:hypothetical protein
MLSTNVACIQQARKKQPAFHLLRMQVQYSPWRSDTTESKAAKTYTLYPWRTRGWVVLTTL